MIRSRMAAGIGLLLLSVAPLAAQDWGRAALGIQAGFTYIKYSGTPFFTSQLDVPVVGFGGDHQPATLYLIAPLTSRLALEPSAVFSVTSSPFFSSSSIQVGLRADYLLTRWLYTAAGVVAARSGSGGTSTRTVGLQAGIGARVQLTSGITGRAEAVAQFWGKDAPVPAENIYSLVFGISAPVVSERHSRTPRAADPGPGFWHLSIGTSASFVDERPQNGVTDLLGLMMPGWGVASSGLFFTPPSAFVTIPVGGHFALEPGFDFHRTHFSGFTYALTELSTRLNYGFSGGWYAGAGLLLVGKKSSGKPAGGVTGVGLEGGYQFHFTGAWGGRIELSHTIMAQQRALHDPPLTLTALTFGATAPLN